MSPGTATQENGKLTQVVTFIDELVEVEVVLAEELQRASLQSEPLVRTKDCFQQAPNTRTEGQYDCSRSVCIKLALHLNKYHHTSASAGLIPPH